MTTSLPGRVRTAAPGDSTIEDASETEGVNAEVAAGGGTLSVMAFAGVYVGIAVAALSLSVASVDVGNSSTLGVAAVVAFTLSESALLLLRTKELSSVVRSCGPALAPDMELRLPEAQDTK